MSGTVFLGASEYSAGERDPFVTVTIQRSGDLSSAATVHYATSPNTATENVDYTDTDGSIVMEAGVASVTVNIPIRNDTVSEATERFALSLVSVENGTLLFPRTANIAILDDENPVTDPAQPPLTTPYTVTTTSIVTGLVEPLAMEFFPGSTKALIVEKAGVIKFVDTAGGGVSALLDIRAEVNSNADRGLLDIALHPDLENSPYLYAFYTVDPPGAVRDDEGNRFAHLVRYELNLDGPVPTIVAGSKTIIMGGAGQTLNDISGGGLLNFTDEQYANNRGSDIDPVTGLYKQDYIKVDSQSHAGGALAFGPDGNLYVSIGDGTSFNYADPRTVGVQKVDSLSGKILRIDPITGLGVSDNPFAETDLSTNQSKVWQMGLRNPYSMTFAEDGRLFISETGWYSYEEINTGPAGANFGWPYYEGGDNGVLIKTPGYQALLGASNFYARVASGEITVTPGYRAFSHTSSDPGYQVSAIVGASTIYTGDKYPEIFKNDYFFSDIVDGEIYSVDINDRTKTQFIMDNGSYGAANFVQSPDGYIYILDIGNGRIARINITDPNAGQNHTPTVAQPIVDKSAVTDTPFSFTLPVTTFADLDNDALSLTARLSSGAALPAWLHFDAATGTFTGQPGAGNAGAITVRVTATDPDGASTFDDFVVTVATPGAETIVNDVKTQNQFLTGTTANDVFLYAGSSTLYSWAPTSDGQSVVIWTDSTSDNTYDVLTGFEKIRFADRTVLVSTLLQPGPDYFDAADTVQHLDGKTANDRFFVNASSANYTWEPAGGGGSTVIIYTNSTTDNTYDLLTGFESIVFTDRTVVLAGSPGNVAPTLANPIADQTIAEEQQLSFTLPANVFADSNGDALTRSATLASGAALPSWLTFNASTGTFTGRPDDAQVGIIAVTVTARDPGGLSVSDTFNLTVTPFNDAPTLVTPIADRTMSTGQALSYAMPSNTFADVDNPTLTLTAKLGSGAALPSWLIFDAASGTFSGTPTSAGLYDIVVTATDPGGKSVSDTFQLNVRALPVNVAPTLANPIIDQTIAEEQQLSFTLAANTFADANGDALTRSATLASGAVLPSWLTFNATTGTFTGRPDDAQVGTIALTVTARDPGGLSVSDTFNLIVTPFNDAPVVAAPIADKSTVAGTALSYVLPANTFSDADNPTLTLTAKLASGAALPSWLTFNATTRTFTGTPATGNVGFSDVIVTATDTGGKAVSDTFRLTVTSVPTGEVLYTNNPNVRQTITGSSANDVFVLGASSTGYQWGTTQDGNGIVVWNSAGHDILYGFEKLRFTNKTVSIETQGPTYLDDPDVVQHLTGRTANDVFVIAGSSAAYSWGPTGSGTGVIVWTTSTADNTYDILNGFEKLQFSDVTVTLSGTGAARMATFSGTAERNVLKGSDLVDRVYGNGGNDYLYGSGGRDVLTGGAGDDSFRFSRVSSPYGSQRDVIMDFDDAGNDVIDLTAASAAVLGWRGGLGFTGVNQVRINDIAGPNLIVEVNLTGDKTPELQVLLAATTLASMTKSDFLL